MPSPKVEKLLESYASGNQVKASNKLLKLTMSGNPDAQFHLAQIYSKNGLRFLASDSWVDLLNHQVEPRELVSRNQYETLAWLGNTKEARRFLETENLSKLNKDLDEREVVRDIEKLKKELSAYILALKKNQYNTSLSSKERQIRELELGVGLGYISSQIFFTGAHYDMGTALLVSGDHSFEIDFDDYVYSPEEYWPELLIQSTRLLRETIYSEQQNRDLVSKLAVFAQDIQERIFFMNQGISATTENEKYSLSAIAFGLNVSRPVAANFYFAILAS